MKNLRVGIIGFDHWYWAYSAIYAAMVHPGVSLVAIADGNEEKVKKLAYRYKADKWYTDYNKVLGDSDVDAVMIFTTTSEHVEIAIKAAQKGKSILINKPIARTVKESEKILKAIKESGVRAMAIGEGDFKNDFPEELADRIGVPESIFYSLKASLPQCKPSSQDPGWFVDPRKAAGGGFIDHACYMVGALRGYLKSEVKAVSANIGKLHHKHLDVEDYGIAVLEFNSGVTATIESTFTGQANIPRRLIITGSEGEVKIERHNGKRKATFWNRKDLVKIESFDTSFPSFVPDDTYLEPFITPPPGIDSFKPTIDEFIEYVLGNKETCQTVESAKTNLEVCLAAYKAAILGRKVNLPLEEDVDYLRDVSPYL